MILGDEEGNVCKLTAWREVAEAWGGTGEALAAKRGDILLIESKLRLPRRSSRETHQAQLFPDRRNGVLRHNIFTHLVRIPLP
jgi:hypothetical protein